MISVLLFIFSIISCLIQYIPRRHGWWQLATDNQASGFAGGKSAV
jgi:hypothetical protein